MKYKTDRGVAGLTILLSLIVMLFVIGLLLMVFAIMSGKLSDSNSLYIRGATNTVGGEVVTQAELIANSLLANGGLRDATCNVVAVYNNTIAGRNITMGNWTVNNCNLMNITSEFTTVNWSVNYTYSYLEDTGAVNVINDTSVALSSTTDWFDIFIVIGAMVVLILLTVIIITAIRSSGMIATTTENKGASKVGTA